MFLSPFTCILSVILAVCTTANAAAIDRALASRQVKPALLRKGYYAAKRLTAASRIRSNDLALNLTSSAYSGQAALLQPLLCQLLHTSIAQIYRARISIVSTRCLLSAPLLYGADLYYSQ